MQNIELKSCYINNKNIKGEPLITSKGEQYNRVVIESINGGKASCNIWQDQTDKLALAKTWRPGMTISVELTQSGEYTNFDFDVPPISTPNVQNTQSPHVTTPLQTNSTLSDDKISLILQSLGRIETQLSVLVGKKEATLTPEDSKEFIVVDDFVQDVPLTQEDIERIEKVFAKQELGYSENM